MGETSAAFAEGAESLFWNPAGLARMRHDAPSDLVVGYSALLQTTYEGSVAYAQPLGPGVFGTSLLYFSQAPQTAYSTTGDSSGQFTPYDMALGASYGMTVSGLLVGATLKMIRSSIADAAGTTAAVDLGVQAPHVSELGDGPIDLGAAITNLGPAMAIGSTPSPLPFAARGGVMWHITPQFSAAGDLVLPVDNSPYVAIGGEFAIPFSGGSAALRAGFNQNRTRTLNGFTGVTAGAGVQFDKFRVDYAWVPFGELGATNRISLGFNF